MVDAHGISVDKEAVMRFRLVSRSMRVSALLAAAVVGSLATVSPGVAYVTGSASGYISVSTAQRSCADVRCPSLRTVSSRTWVGVACWRDGGPAHDTHRWFRVNSGGIEGWVSAGAMSSQPAVPYCSEMRAGETLFAGQSVWSSNGAFRLIMQTDGNVVVYGPGGALWSARTTGAVGARLVMQPDGNLVVYDHANRAAWHTGTSNSGSRFVIQSDGNAVLYTSSDGVLYATNAHQTEGWVRGDNNGYVGQCTRYALERFKAYSGKYPSLYGDAHTWNEVAAQRGWLVQSTPQAQSIVVFEATASSRFGHVAWVDGVRIVNGAYSFHVWEANRDGRGVGTVTERWVVLGSGMSFIMARSL